MNVGTVTYRESRHAWAIKCEPYVMIRLKRVFARLKQDAYGVALLSDTEENCRELFWFLSRYPMEVEPRDVLESRSAAHIEREDKIAKIISAGYVPPTFDQLAIPAREYQRVAADLLLRNGALLLADDVGLGKTASAICALTEHRALPALVVTLTHLPRQWEAEIGRFAPWLKTHILTKGKPYDLMKKCGDRFPDVIIANYHKLAGWADVLAGQVHTIIFDEAQELRHEGTAKYNAAKHIADQAAYRIGLTATPIYNYGGEIYNVINALRADSLGTHDEFMREWCSGNGYGGDRPRIRDPKAFGAYVRSSGLMLRRTRTDVGRELPALSRSIHHIDADTDALDKIGKSAAELARIILQQGETKRGQKMSASEELSNILRQATGIAKAPYVAEFVRLLVESGEKVVLYGWHRTVYDIWLDRLKDLNPVMYTGSESVTQKEAAKAAFISGASQILIISLRSGAGLDGLQQVCRTVVFGELDWSPGVHEQCVGRIYRDGQPDPVLAYYLLAEAGSDPIVADVLNLKKSQIDGVRDPEADLIETLEVEEGHIKRLAESFLRDRGIPLPVAVDPPT
jgi:SNF2 family DNA or RNA helicase